MLKNNCSLNDEEVFDSAFEGKILCPIQCSVQHCSGCRRVKQHAWEDDEYWFQWGVCKEKTRDVRLNGGFAKRKCVIFA